MTEWITKQQALKVLGIKTKNFHDCMNAHNVFPNSHGLYNAERINEVLLKLQERRYPALKEILPCHILREEMAQIMGCRPDHIRGQMKLKPIGKMADGRTVYDRDEFLEAWEKRKPELEIARIRNGAAHRKPVKKFSPEQRRQYPLATRFLMNKRQFITEFNDEADGYPHVVSAMGRIR